MLASTLKLASINCDPGSAQPDRKLLTSFPAKIEMTQVAGLEREIIGKLAAPREIDTTRLIGVLAELGLLKNYFPVLLTL